MDQGRSHADRLLPTWPTHPKESAGREQELAIARPRALEVVTGVLTNSGCRRTPVGAPRGRSRVATPASLSLRLRGCFQFHCSFPSLPHSTPIMASGVLEETEFFYDFRSWKAEEGELACQQGLARQAGSLVSLLDEWMVESRNQEPPGKGVGYGSYLSYTNSKINALTLVCSIDISWCSASSANYWECRCLFYSS